MEEEKKVKSNNKILTIILSLLIFCLLVFCILGLINNNSLKDDIKKLEKENTSLKANTSNNNSEEVNKPKEEKNYLDYVDDPKVKIYGIHYDYIVFSYDDELYISVSGDGIQFNIALGLAGYSEFKNDIASTNTGNTEVRVRKLNIKTNDVSKVILKHADTYRDPTGEAYILYKDNGLTHFYVGMGLENVTNDKVLTEYKEIVDVKTTCLDDFDCANVKYTIYTKDGNQVELDKIK